MPTQRMPNDLSHLQGCPAAVLLLCYFGYLRKYTRLSSLSPIYAAEKPVRIIPAWTILPAQDYLVRPRRDWSIGEILRLYTSDHYSGAPGTYPSR